MSHSSLTKQALLAVADRLKHHAAVFVSDGGRGFSAVLLVDNDRHFALTAAHCLRDITDRSSLWISTFGNQRPGIPTPQVTLRVHEHLDVGVVELDPSVASRIEASWLTVSDVDSTKVQPGETTALLGFPAGLFDVQHGEGQTILAAQPVVFGLEVSPDWPKVELDNKADVRNDLFLQWDITRMIDPTTNEAICEFEIEGMSGSGVFWVPRLGPDDLWSPTQVRLAGVLNSTIEREGLIRCTRAEHALTLLGYRVEIENTANENA